jgi:hypothetical protein
MPPSYIYSVAETMMFKFRLFKKEFGADLPYFKHSVITVSPLCYFNLASHRLAINYQSSIQHRLASNTTILGWAK